MGDIGLVILFIIYTNAYIKHLLQLIDRPPSQLNDGDLN